MSQSGTISSSSGGGGITTINGDTGSATGPIITIYANVAAQNSGSTVSFVAAGTTSTFNVTDVNSNTLVGSLAGNATLSGGNNVGLGDSVLGSLTSGFSNGFLGSSAGVSLLSGSLNAGIGSVTLANLTTGSNNCALGANSLSQLKTGNYNIGLGFNVGHAYAGAESGNITIGAPGVVGESNITRIGFSTLAGPTIKSFMDGIYAVITGGPAIPVLVDASGQLGTGSSSKRYKDDIKDMGSDTDRLMKLRPVTFAMKNDASKIKNYGLIAEEVHEVFPELVVYKDGIPEAVRYHDLAVMLLNEFQKLRRGK